VTGSLRGDVAPVVRLGHDLVRNFEALPPDTAAVEIATHIRKFWEPRMRQELLARVRWGDTSLHPLLVRAAEDLVDGDVARTEVREPSQDRAGPPVTALDWCRALSRRAAGHASEVRAWRPSRSPVCARSTGASQRSTGST
jgi:formate dehydrogenase subunit delta